ncbi:MAG TPA: cyanophycinase [Pyrinomonadaceae bacterium]|nr:cyanophycinase [Pyrinomonadaceae bacterium]
MRWKSVLLSLSFLLSFSQLVAGRDHKGAFLLSGAAGGSRESFGAGVLERFVALAGGPDAEFVYIPTASSGIKLDNGFIYEPPDSDTPAANTKEFERELAKMFGVRHVTVLHTRSRATANSESFVAPLKKAGGVWLSGGNSGRLASTYLGTLTLKAIRAVYERGGVVGGNSAGAIIQGSFIVRGRPDKPVLMAKGHERGFGFLKRVVVNPHLTAAKREDELVNVLDAHPELLGIGLDEKGAILVRGGQFEVLGESRVAIYDNRRHERLWYYWLAPGTVFDLRTRAVAAPLKRSS